jgi:Flp pilus assembly protein TadG
MATPVHARRRGQVFLEFALVLPLCLMMFAAMVDMGLYLHRYLSIQTAVREGARQAVQGSGDDRIRAAVLVTCDATRLLATDVTVVRRESDAQFATLPAAAGAPINLKDHVKGYESIEIRVVTPHRYLMPFVFQGQTWANIAVTVKTVRVL